MPLDGHALLVSQGWSGTGTGLRKGAISRPITAPQKRNLAGIGKDRDEAFPFWDHLFTVAASAIRIECFSSDDDEHGPQPDAKVSRPSTLELRQTSTGILSNRPPIIGSPVSSGATTPTPCSDATPGSSSAPRPSLLALAKREAARRALYSRFFRGPILGPDDVQSEMVKMELTATPQISSRRHHHDVIEGSSETRRNVDARAHGEDTLRGEDADKEERKRERRLRKDAERAARKVKRLKERSKGKGREEEGIASPQAANDRPLSSLSQEQDSGPLMSTSPGEMPHAKGEKKKRKRCRAASVDGELDAQLLVSADERTLEREVRGKSRRQGSPKRSRKRRRRDRFL